MIIPILAGIFVLGGTIALLNKVLGAKSLPTDDFKLPHVLSSIRESDDMPGDLVEVDLKGETWLVAPDYIGPIGIGEAAAMAASLGFELPSPELVDAIWRQADLKLKPRPRNNVISQAVFDDQKRVIAEQIGGRPFTLLGGSFKDIVQVGGHPQLYGWHVEDGETVAGVPLHKPVTPGPGKIIQPRSGNVHSLGFKDYSQGVRLVRRAT